MGTIWMSLCRSAQQPILSNTVSFLLEWLAAGYLRIWQFILALM